MPGIGCRKENSTDTSVACHLSPDTLRRYARHLVLPEIGEEGQRRLLASSALIIGAGGLGSAAIAYLAAAGIGRLGIVEPDRVELSNLQRQVLFESADIGRPKAEAAADRIEEIGADCVVELFAARLDDGNARSLIQRFFRPISATLSSPLPNPPPQAGEGMKEMPQAGEGMKEMTQAGEGMKEMTQAGEGIVLDCSDNFATRFALADACMQERKTLISAAISGFEAQLSTFKPHFGAPHPCYRCLVPQMPGRERTCAQEGIIGPLAGVMGSLQALEAIKELLGIGQSMSGRLLVMDALSMQIKMLALPKDPACPACG